MSCHAHIPISEENSGYKSIAAMCVDCESASRTDGARAIRSALHSLVYVTNVDMGRPATYEQHQLLASVRVRAPASDEIVAQLRQVAMEVAPVGISVVVVVAEQIEGDVVVRYPGAIRYMDGI